VSCGSTSSCVAVDVSGEILSFDGSRWSDMSSTDFVAGGSISCPSAEFCALADGQGHVLTYDGSKWSAPVDVRPDTNDTDNTVSCASEKFCVFVDGDGYASVYDGSHWSRATNVDPEIAQSASGNPIGGEGLGVSCTSATFCAAVDGTGAALTYSNGSHGTSTTAPGAAPSGTIRASGAIRGDWKLTRAAQCTVHAAKAGADVELVTGGHGPTLTINVLKKGATATAVGLRGTRDFLVRLRSASGRTWLSGWDHGHFGAGTLGESAGARSGTIQATMTPSPRDGAGSVTVRATWSCGPSGGRTFGP
ncbi:MAG: hypothetical protein ACRDV8_01510, partial [Acidimicrobiales bacterium]